MRIITEICSYFTREEFRSFRTAPGTSILSRVDSLRQTFKSELPRRDYLDSRPVPTTPLRGCKLRRTTSAFNSPEWPVLRRRVFARFHFLEDGAP